MKEDWRKQFDEKFPFRIYGVAGEPKTEFIATKNLPDAIKAFIDVLLTTRTEQAVAEERAYLKKKFEMMVGVPNNLLDMEVGRVKALYLWQVLEALQDPRRGGAKEV